ncbi:cryptochrome/photolyase family protein [Pseudomonadota bacterium]
MNKKYSRALFWFRRDLRLSDNPAMSMAIAEADQVTPIYLHCQQEEAPWVPGAASNWWLHHSLTDLQRNVRRLGLVLIIRDGDSSRVMLERLIADTGAAAVYWNRLYEPAVTERDSQVEEALSGAGIRVHTFNASLLNEPWEVATRENRPYKVFTPYYKSCRGGIRPERGLHAPPVRGSGNVSPPDSIAIERLGLLPRGGWTDGLARDWTPGEAGAMSALDAFTGSEAPFHYPRDRDLPASAGVSRLSPHLHFGEVAPARVWFEVAQRAVIEKREFDAEPYLRQLVWRDFAHHLLYYFPHTATEEFNPRFGRFPWRRDPALFDAWSKGMTGIPLIDAGMRQLWQSGWMHNRVRMNVASFLTKHCLIDWRDGARWFWDTLVDADLANNTMGWQWAAGCGADAAPFFRIFNPVRQGEKFDPEGDYVRTWIPELSHLGANRIHKPWDGPDPAGSLSVAGQTEYYPSPIVDLARGRNDALEAYRSIRNQPE